MVLSALCLIQLLGYVYCLEEFEQCLNGHIVNNSDYECHEGPQSIFEYLIYPTSTMQFRSQFFQNQPLYIARQNEYYNIESIPFVNAYNNILNTIDHASIYDSTFSQISVTSYNPNATTNKLKFTKTKPWIGSHINQAQITQLTQNSVSNNSYSIKFGNTEKYLEAIHDLSFALSAELGVGIRANLFYTQPNGKTSRPHFGTEDVFILQLNGSSNWKVYSNMQKYCISVYLMANAMYYPWNVNATDTYKDIEKKSLLYCHQNVITNLSPSDEKFGGYGIFDEEKLSLFDATIDTVLSAGDFLYFPRGFVHDTDAFDVTMPSVHLAIGIYQELQCDFFFVLVKCMFTIESLNTLMENMFYNYNVSKELILKELEYFLTYQTYIDVILRETMPYGFYHYDIFEHIVYDDIVLSLMQNTFGKFVKYIKGEVTKKDIEKLMNILKEKKSKSEISKKIYAYYNNVIVELDGVYLPINHREHFKRISYSLRDSDKITQLPKFVA